MAEKRFPILRDILAEQIKQAIENGSLDLTESGDDIYRLEITGRTIAVIITDDERIISVYPIG
jgi:hypothetical protein